MKPPFVGTNAPVSSRQHNGRSRRPASSSKAVFRSSQGRRIKMTWSGTLLTAAATGKSGYAETGHPCRRARGWKVAVNIAAAKGPMIWIQRRLPAKFDRLGATMKNAAMLNAAGMEIAFPPTIFLMKSDAEAAL